MIPGESCLLNTKLIQDVIVKMSSACHLQSSAVCLQSALGESPLPVASPLNGFLGILLSALQAAAGTVYPPSM
jgi:hypothetical protein